MAGREHKENNSGKKAFVTFVFLVVKDQPRSCSARHPSFIRLETNQISNQLQAHNGTIFAEASPDV
jgi:hypothetical protein